MKLFYTLLVVMASSFYLKAQTLKAEYQIVQDIYANVDGKGDRKITALESVGFLYRKDSRYIYFQKPSYLDQYPSGKIVENVGANHNYSINLFMDTVQRLNYKDMDSLIKRYRPDMTGKDGINFNYIQNFEADFYTWEMHSETKEIQGLKCQKASLTIREIPQWVVWFTAQVPMQAGIDNIIGIPGLIVEAESIPLKARYSLIKYTAGISIPDEVFWPAEFKQPFEKMRDLKKSNNTSTEKTKLQKLAELTNQ